VLEIILFCFVVHSGLSRIWLLCSPAVDFLLFYSASNLASDLVLRGGGKELLFVSDNSQWELNLFSAGTVTCNQTCSTLCVIIFGPFVIL